MISDRDGSLRSQYFLNVTNARICFAFKSSGLITCLECTSDKKLLVFLSCLNEINGRSDQKILPVPRLF